MQCDFVTPSRQKKLVHAQNLLQGRGGRQKRGVPRGVPLPVYLNQNLLDYLWLLYRIFQCLQCGIAAVTAHHDIEIARFKHLIALGIVVGEY